jgi:hypothetical protein
MRHPCRMIREPGAPAAAPPPRRAAGQRRAGARHAGKASTSAVKDRPANGNRRDQASRPEWRPLPAPGKLSSPSAESPAAAGSAVISVAPEDHGLSARQGLSFVPVPSESEKG